VTRDQLQLLKRLTDNVTLALDADAAGEEAVRRSIYEAEQLDVNLQIVQFDFAKDPDEAIQKDLKRFKKAVDNPVPIFDYMFDLLQTKHNVKDPFGKKKLSDEYLTIIRSIKNPIVQTHYVKKLATLLEVGERTIERELEKVRQKKYKTSTKSMLAQPRDQEQRDLKIQKYFLSILLQSDLSDDEFSQIKELLEPREFSTPAFQNLYEQVMLQRKGDFPAQLNDQLKSVYDELYLYASYEAEFSHESKEKLAFEIKKNYLKRMISEVLANKELTENQKKNLKEYGEQLKEVEKKALTL
ncbi:MAG: toprim domain-containing protein, partial [Patescibacteria group bacterium]